MGDIFVRDVVNSNTTLVLYMALHHLHDIRRHLATAGMPASTPVALIENGSLPKQRQFFTTLDRMAEVAAEEDCKSPTLVIIGKVVNLGDVPANWQSSPELQPETALHV